MIESGDPTFRSTRWSVVLAAGDGDRADRSRALEDLSAAYWYPLYAFARRLGHDAPTAEDLVQGFFARLLADETIAVADPGRGRFRSFLRTAFRHHAGHERERAAAKKRGGGRRLVSIDRTDAEGRYAIEPATPTRPDDLFDRRWALTLLDQVLSDLRERYDERGQGMIFEALKGTLTGGHAPWADAATRLGMSEGAVKVAAHRLRQRYGEAIRSRVADTVADPAEVEAEIDDLLAALRVRES